MIKKIKFVIIILFFSFIFFVFFKGLDKPNSYLPKKNIKEIVLGELISKNSFSIVNIWASWCLPCRDEHEYLLKLKNLNKINVIGINYKDKKSNAAKFLSDLGNPYHEVLIDLDGTKSIEFGAIGVPETYLINNKIIVKKYIGPLDQSKLKDIIEIIKNEKN